MVKIILFALVILTHIQNVFSQNTLNKTSSALKVGDKFPDYTFTNLINHPNKTAKFSEFKGQLVILDFWTTYCASCIKSWPKLLEIQKKFEGKVKIILVNATQDEALIRPLLDMQKKVLKVDMTLPIVCKDMKLLDMFPHEGDPYIIWINQHGYVQSITEGSFFNENNIKKVLENKDVKLRQATTEIIRPQASKPLFVNNNGGNGEQILEQSVIAGYIPGMISTTQISADEKVGYFIRVTSSDLTTMILYAYIDQLNSKISIDLPSNNRIIFKVSDTSKYVPVVDGVPNFPNYFNYQFITKPTTKQALYLKMQEDIKRFFKLDIKMEKLKRKCLVFTASDTSKITYKSGKIYFNINSTGGSLNKVDINFLMGFIENQFYYNSPYPFVNETNFKGDLGSIILEDVNMGDYKALAEAFKKYDIDITLEDREIETLIVSERKE